MENDTNEPINEEALDKLRLDLRSWLESVPEEGEILAYAREVGSADKQALITETAFLLLTWKMGELRTYLYNHQLLDVTDPSQFYDWFRVTALSAQYSPASVFNQVGTEDKRIAALTPPSDFHHYAEKFIRTWVSGLRLATVFTYLHQLPYLESLSHAFPERAMLESYQEDIKRIFIRDGNHLRTGSSPSRLELEEDKQILLKSAIFPELYIKEVLNADNQEEKATLLGILITCLTLLLETVSDRVSSADTDQAARALWLQLQLEQERATLAETVAAYKIEQGVKDWRAGFFKNLYELWTEENVTSGQAKASLIEYIHKIDSRQLSVFRRCLELFWSESAFMRVNFDPLPVEDVITALQATSNRAQLKGIIEGVQDNVYDYGQKEYLKTCIESMYEVLKTIPSQPFASLRKE